MTAIDPHFVISIWSRQFRFDKTITFCLLYLPLSWRAINKGQQFEWNWMFCCPLPSVMACSHSQTKTLLKKKKGKLNQNKTSIERRPPFLYIKTNSFDWWRDWVCVGFWGGLVSHPGKKRNPRKNLAGRVTEDQRAGWITLGPHYETPTSSSACWRS